MTPQVNEPFAIDEDFNPNDFVKAKRAAIHNYLSQRGGDLIPQHIEADLESVKVAEAAAAFRPSCHNHALLVEQAQRQLEADIGPASARRRHELRVAEMIQRDVVPRYAIFDEKLAELPAKMRNCRDTGVVALTPMGDVKHRWPEKCRLSKVCPHEAREEGQRIAARYLPPMQNYMTDHPRARLYYLVISPRNVPPGQLYDFKREMFRALLRVRDNTEDPVLKHLAGMVVVQEDPVGKDWVSWNVHLNLLMIFDGGTPNYDRFRRAITLELGQTDCLVQCEWQDQSDMRRAWMRRARSDGGPVSAPSRQGLLASAFREILKYITKMAGSNHVGGLSAGAEAPSMDRWTGPQFYEWWQANRGFRRTRSYGVLFRVCDCCGGYDHTEFTTREGVTTRNCPEEPEPEPVPESIGMQSWHSGRETYELYIGLIPADNFSGEGQNFASNSPRGPPYE